MILLELFIWWYGPGWWLMVQRIGGRVSRMGKIFAIPTLLGTLFSPWKRIVTVGAKGIDAQMRALVDNLVSRTVGFVVRSMVLFAALLSIFGAFIVGIAIALIWPVVPVLVVYFLVLGVM